MVSTHPKDDNTSHGALILGRCELMVDAAKVAGGLVAASGRRGLDNDALFGRHVERYAGGFGGVEVRLGCEK